MTNDQLGAYILAFVFTVGFALPFSLMVWARALQSLKDRDGL